METNQLTILGALGKIHEVSKDSLFAEEQFINVENEIKFVCDYFKINKIQSLLLANIVGLTGYDSTESLKRIGQHFGVNEIVLLQHFQELQELINRKIVDKGGLRRYGGTGEYSLNKALFTFLVKNEKIPLELMKFEVKEHSFQQFLAEIEELSELKERNEINDKLMFNYQLREITERYKDIKMVDYILTNFKDCSLDMFVFLDTIIDVIKKNGNDFNTVLESTVDDGTFTVRAKFDYISNFLADKTLLNKLKLVEKNKNTFGNDHNIRLSEKSLKLLREWEGIKFEVINKDDKLLYPNKIQPIELFYNSSEKTQLETVMNCLSNGAFQKMQKRLKTNNMPIGITTLLYGAPGTGKTETVYQLAKKYKRPIFKVEISETKSMWFGESQKLIKKVFTDYKELKQSEKICPILLFNEADAIIGKRKNAGSSAVADTENAIQNILLEELENFDGILFATSNLIGNIDKAFERRFLFKIKFDTPTTENAAHIWKNKLPVISTDEAKHLAQKFSFSGGEMENIARKCVMKEVIAGKKSTFEDILRFCKNEKWSEGNRAIGF